MVADARAHPQGATGDPTLMSGLLWFGKESQRIIRQMFMASDLGIIAVLCCKLLLHLLCVQGTRYNQGKHVPFVILSEK